MCGGTACKNTTKMSSSLWSESHSYWNLFLQKGNNGQQKSLVLWSGGLKSGRRGESYLSPFRGMGGILEGADPRSRILYIRSWSFRSGRFGSSWKCNHVLKYEPTCQYQKTNFYSYQTTFVFELLKVKVMCICKFTYYTLCINIMTSSQWRRMFWCLSNWWI